MNQNAWTDADIAIVKRMAAEGRRARDIALAVNRSEAAIYNLRKTRPEFELSGTRALVLAPADFAEQWQAKSLVALAKHYRRSPATISRWCKEQGLIRPPCLNIGRAPREKKVSLPKAPKQPTVSRPISFSRAAVAMAPKDRVYRDPTVA
ncbi:MAG: hypothetical protein NTX28_00220, partial [Novosphingobium sp.]|nr:hypothetical protein [Novosphingobium sp.]